MPLDLLPSETYHRKVYSKEVSTPVQLEDQRNHVQTDGAGRQYGTSSASHSNNNRSKNVLKRSVDLLTGEYKKQLRIRGFFKF